MFTQPFLAGELSSGEGAGGLDALLVPHISYVGSAAQLQQVSIEEGSGSSHQPLPISRCDSLTLVCLFFIYDGCVQVR